MHAAKSPRSRQLAAFRVLAHDLQKLAAELNPNMHSSDCDLRAEYNACLNRAAAAFDVALKSMSEADKLAHEKAA